MPAQSPAARAAPIPAWADRFGLAWRAARCAAVALALSLTSSCGSSGPIPLGFSGTLTGTYADLGVQGRNGATLAVEDLNARGGVAGRQVRLLVEDDLGTPEGAVAADARLRKAGVVAIIGHMTSGLSAAALPEAEHAHRALFSPSSSSPAFTGKADVFFRTAPSSLDESAALATHIQKTRAASRAHVVLDSDNAAYTQPFADSFARSFTDGGGTLAGRWSFSSRSAPDFDALAAKIDGGKETCLLIVASSRDTAAMVQAVRRRGLAVLLAGAGWARTGDLPKYGGKTVEGMIFSGPFDKDAKAQRFIDFQHAYVKRFGSDPNFAAVYAYEAVLFLAKAIEESKGAPDGILKALPGMKIGGLLGDLALDAYGDIKRPSYIEEVQNQEFRIIGIINQ